MRIQRVQLASACLAETAHFYAALGLRTTAEATSAQVRIGSGVLTLVSGPPTTGAHHITLTVPSAVLPHART